MTVSILPPNATPAERAFEAALAGLCDLPVPVGDLWNPARCPAALLPWLAWALSVDDWDSTWSEERKRAVIAASVEVHRHKGTVGSVRRALRAAGWGDAEIHERWGSKFYDGMVPRDGSRTRVPEDHWAEYRVTLDRPISVEQAARVRRLLGSVAPARCHLKALSYRAALHLYNRTVPRNGTYTRGIA